VSTAEASPEDWRGVAAEQVDDVSREVGLRLRRRSRDLLGSLLRPHRAGIAVASTLLLVQNVSGLAGPYLVSVGIDAGLPRLVDSGDVRVMAAVVATLAATGSGRRSCSGCACVRSGTSSRSRRRSTSGTPPGGSSPG
jgi:ATP-binding cassette subfamily B protein